MNCIVQTLVAVTALSDAPFVPRQNSDFRLGQIVSRETSVDFEPNCGHVHVQIFKPKREGSLLLGGASSVWERLTLSHLNADVKNLDSAPIWPWFRTLFSCILPNTCSFLVNKYVCNIDWQKEISCLRLPCEESWGTFVNRLVLDLYFDSLLNSMNCYFVSCTEGIAEVFVYFYTRICCTVIVPCDTLFCIEGMSSLLPVVCALEHMTHSSAPDVQCQGLRLCTTNTYICSLFPNVVHPQFTLASIFSGQKRSAFASVNEFAYRAKITLCELSFSEQVNDMKFHDKYRKSRLLENLKIWAGHFQSLKIAIFCQIQRTKWKEKLDKKFRAHNWKSWTHSGYRCEKKKNCCCKCEWEVILGAFCLLHLRVSFLISPPGDLPFCEFLNIPAWSLVLFSGREGVMYVSVVIVVEDPPPLQFPANSFLSYTSVTACREDLCWIGIPTARPVNWQAELYSPLTPRNSDWRCSLAKKGLPGCVIFIHFWATLKTFFVWKRSVTMQHVLKMMQNTMKHPEMQKDYDFDSANRRRRAECQVMSTLTAYFTCMQP